MINVEKMAKGYVEMGDINLEIAQEGFYAEDEVMRKGVVCYEMDKKNTKDYSTRNRYNFGKDCKN